MTLSVVVPVGPQCRLDFVCDTLDSVDAYCPDRHLIVLDDSGHARIGYQAFRGRHDAALLVPEHRGLRGQLFLNLCQAFRFALQNPFDVLLRLDTDALVAGDGFQAAAAEYFAAHPKVGSLGVYRHDYDGRRRPRAVAARRLLFEATLGGARNPALAWRLDSLLGRAKVHGYRLGESVAGGALLYSRLAVERLADRKLLPPSGIRRSGLREETLFALVLKAAGLSMADFGRGDDDLPCAVMQGALPAAPRELLDRGKSLIHSTVGHGSLTEAEIRAVFRDARVSSGLTGGSTVDVTDVVEEVDVTDPSISQSDRMDPTGEE